MSISRERAVERAVRAAEMRRRSLAACASVACMTAAAFVLLAMVRFPGRLSDSVLRSLVAFSLAAGIVLGARALDGPIRMREHRRGHVAASEAAGALLMWLGCFVTLMAAFLISDVAARFDPARHGIAETRPPSPPKAPAADRMPPMAVRHGRHGMDEATSRDVAACGPSDANGRCGSGAAVR